MSERQRDEILALCVIKNHSIFFLIFFNSVMILNRNRFCDFKENNNLISKDKLCDQSLFMKSSFHEVKFYLHTEYFY
jgi:hypothetical protein